MQGKINPANYEAYFLMYVDNELSRDERAEVEAFLLQHPETQSMLEELLRTRQAADPAIVFPNKSKLFFGAATVTDDALLSYLDKEAVPAAISEALQHPDPELAKRLQAFEKTIAVPDMSVVYPDKARLYRTSKLVSLKRWGSAVAAAVAVIAVGTILWMQPHGHPGVADAGHSRQQESLAGNSAASVPAEPHIAAADTLPQPGNTEQGAVAAYKAPGHPENDNRVVKKEHPTAATHVPVVAQTKPATAVPGQPTQVLRNTDVDAPKDANLAAHNVETPPPAVLKPAPSVPPALAATGEENQPKTKKSLFKKLTQRIEERVSGALVNDEGQVTIAGFAVNVK
ncbi:hypothetical protein [Niabella sp.]|uniref:anti-sigma factor family protein n=1 Tax=Niabella sp. TaxID=1962976 RepID=UPI0026070F56|nr:hypothetical protein [Niabella sp.]